VRFGSFNEEGIDMAFKSGDFVGIRCEVRPGPFEGEKLIAVDTVEGTITGFVQIDELRQSGQHWEVRGKVQELNGDTIKVLIYGGFFTTNGIANISSDLAIAA
jgi:hypothetical protein